jgi:malate/lactate dehydrogenase
MRDVAILGAGELGGSLAHLLARRNVTTRIRLIEPVQGLGAPSASDLGRIAVGKALDIQQAAAIEGFATTLAGSSDVTNAADAAVLVIADPAHGTWSEDDSLALLRQTRYAGTDPLIVCAGASHRVLVERAVRELHLRPDRILGTAPEALAAGVRALVALEVDGSAREVALTVLGIPPERIVIGWDGASLGGRAATQVLDETARRRVSARAAHLWPPGPHALAAAACAAIGANLEHLQLVLSGFAGPDDSEGMRTRAAALPLRVGASGVEVVGLETLSPRERTDLGSALYL